MLSTLTSSAIAATAAIAAASTLTVASLSPESQLFGHTLVAGRDPAEMALTYDDGPNDAATPELLDILARHNARATFFMIGRWALQRPDIVRRVAAAGHLIGNHTMTHPWLHTKPAAVIREELRSCNHALEDILGQPVRFFRAPHGARRPAVLRAARDLNLTVVQWNVMGHDWRHETPGPIQAWVEKGISRAHRKRRGSNILLHDGFDIHMGSDRSATLAVTDLLLTRFAREGARTVTVDAWI